MARLTDIIHEIHRRSLWQVVGIYLVVSWIALQVVDVLQQNFGLPEWFPAFALGLLVLGLPIVVATAFVQEGLGARPRAEAEAGSAGRPVERAATAEGSGGLLTWRNALFGGGAALALWGAIAAGWMLFGNAGNVVEDGEATRVAAVAGPSEDLRSIAVLPFATRSEQQADEYFSEGMHDDLLTQLSKIDSLTVISRTSVMQYAATTKTISEIADELGVATVLEGGIQRAGERVRVNVQLIEAASDRHLWAETYDEELSAANIFAIQSDLATKIASALSATLTPEVAQRLETVPTESMEAYELYTRARYAWETRGAFGQDLEEVEALFETALAADSSYALSWLGLANTVLSAWNWGQMGPEIAHPRAREALERALELDPALAEAYATEARLLSFERRLDEAEDAVLTGLELNPGSAAIHARYAQILEALGRYDEAVSQSRRAIELDPLSVNYRNLLADRLFYSRDFPASIAESRKVLEMEPDDWYAWYNLGWAAATGGDPGEAVGAFRESLRSAGDNAASVKLGLAYAFARAGNRDSTVVYLSDANRASYDTAVALFELGDTDEAFSALEEAFETDAAQLQRLGRDPSADNLRADPRYAELAARFAPPN
jgi:TolB-like protein/Flp pilus assembly protein TadD